MTDPQFVLGRMSPGETLMMIRAEQEGEPRIIEVYDPVLLEMITALAVGYVQQKEAILKSLTTGETK